VLDAFSSRTEIQFRWGKELSDRLQTDPEGVIERAKAIKATGQKLSATEVLSKLLGRELPSSGADLEIRLAPDKKPVAKIRQDGSGGVVVKVAPGVITTDKLSQLQELLANFLKE
jgi:ParB family chromosome partitioning protein